MSHLSSAADPNHPEEDHKTALHRAAWNCDHVLMEMLLEAGADTRAMDVNGCVPLQYLLKVIDVRHTAVPELCYQLLLNYGAPRIYPPMFHKVQTPACLDILVSTATAALHHVECKVGVLSALCDFSTKYQ